jgi:hypothetical protein
MQTGWIDLCGLLLIPALLAAQAPEKGERDRAMSYLHATRKQLLDAIEGLSEEQWRWKPAPDRWSVAEVAEHITAAEQFIFEEAVQKLLQGPKADPQAIAKTKGKDEIIPQRVPDRSRRVQAPEPIVPVGRFANRAELTAAFRERRDRTIEFIEKTQAELRSYVAPHPALGEIDAYQWVLFLAAHTDRHIRQLIEVKQTPGFPAR